MQFFIISTFALCLYILLDIEFNDQMWETNTVLTVYLQEHQFSGEKEVFLFFSYSLFVMPGIALIAFLFFDNKLGALLYVCMIQTVFAENSILKNLYYQARPYFIEKTIQPYECNKEFGKPSGHAMSSSAMCFLIPCIIFPAILRDQQNYKYPFSLRVIVIIILTVWTFMTGFSRVFMGVHSFGQILLGWVYSAYSIIIYNQIFLYLFYICVIFIIQLLIIEQSNIQIHTSNNVYNQDHKGFLIMLLKEQDYLHLVGLAYQFYSLNSIIKYYLMKMKLMIGQILCIKNVKIKKSITILIALKCYIIFVLVQAYIFGYLSVSSQVLNQVKYSLQITYFLVKTQQSIDLSVINFNFDSHNYNLIPKYIWASIWKNKILPVSILFGLQITYIYSQYQLLNIYSKILNYFKLTVEGDFIQMSSQLVSTPEGYKASELGQINF